MNDTTAARRVIITGAASGIGAETMAQLKRRGARVVGLDLNVEGDLIRCDVREQESVERAFAEAVERLGGVDVLINSAGVGFAQRATEMPAEDAIAVLDINLFGTWRMTAAALPELRKAKGRILNVASGLAHMTVPLAPAYCASKRAIVAYSDALRYEVGHEVAVTTIYPGYIRTPIHDNSTEQGFGLEGMVPEEKLTDASTAIVRAALEVPKRDVATTRSGTLSYWFVRRLPRALVDAGVLHTVRRQLKRKDFTDSPLAGEFARALKGAKK